MGVRSKRKRRARRSPKSAPPLSDIQGTGMPAKDSIRDIVTFVSPQKKRYRILRTTETDTYDPPLKRGKTTKRT